MERTSLESNVMQMRRLLAFACDTESAQHPRPLSATRMQLTVARFRITQSSASQIESEAPHATQTARACDPHNEILSGSSRESYVKAASVRRRLQRTERREPPDHRKRAKAFVVVPPTRKPHVSFRPGLMRDQRPVLGMNIQKIAKKIPKRY